MAGLLTQALGVHWDLGAGPVHPGYGGPRFVDPPGV